MEVLDVSRSTTDSDQSQGIFAYERLRQLVREGRFTFGVLVSEQVLADEIGVGRTPVREAVSRLAHEGLLNRIPKRGVMVRALDVGEVRDLYDMRECLEEVCVRRAARQMTDSELERVAQAIEDAKAAVEGGCTWLHYRALDREFHSQLWQASRNDRMIAYLDSLHDAAILDLTFQRVLGMPEQGWRSIKEHTAIYEAILARDAQAAVEVSALHHRSYQKVLAAQILGSDWDSADG
jgi:DNA-binding GntR family transcriptional regulator